MAIAEALDSPLSLVALMVVPIGIYFMFKILLWDYTVRAWRYNSQPFAICEHGERSSHAEC